jgi:hypothetical protein
MQSTQDRTAQNALSLDVLWNLRTKVEKVLKEKFPATTVDVSGGKPSADPAALLQDLLM